jgi:hypothetical protein
VRLRDALTVQMTEAFASAVTVTVPILALAAGTEARALRQRLRRLDPDWERKFAEHAATRDLDPAGPPSEVLEYFRGVPGVSKAYVAERLLAVCGAVAWLVVFALLAVTELLGLVWLGDGGRPGDAGLATFSVVSVALALAALIITPALYLFIPVLLPLDLIPHGLKKAVAPRLASPEGRGFVRLLLSELEESVNRAAEKAKAAAGEGAPPGAAGEAADGAGDPS